MLYNHRMAQPSPPRHRLDSIDALRGLIMIVMAIDHVRDFVHIGAQQYSPTDLSRTYPFLFFTRWITHFCAPVFSLTAGLGAYFWLQRPGRTRIQLSRFLLTRGLWLILLELTVMRFAYIFTYSLQLPFLLLVLWILGACMIVLAALVHIPLRFLAPISIAVILLHNTLDPLKPAAFGHYAPLWELLHQPGGFPVLGVFVVVGYPLIPWFAVMSLGFCFGRIFHISPPQRQQVLLSTGVGMTLMFIALRASNGYGDASHWSAQPTRLYTLLSFLDCTKYPPSLLYLLMTLGPALILLAWLDTRAFSPSNPLIVFGRVPLFYFVTHFYLAHLAACLIALVRYGHAAFAMMTNPFPSLGGDPANFPANFGSPLWAVYLVWFIIVVILYFPCRWFAKVKQTRRDWWLSYL